MTRHWDWRDYQSDKPWRKQRSKGDNRITLWAWRKQADRRAKLLGAEWACNMCKRPCKGQGARLTLFITGKPFKRRLCYACAALVRLTVLDEEAKSRNAHLPILEI